MSTSFKKTHGFTVLEIVIVILVLSIVALGTTRFIVQGTQQYSQSAERTKLIAVGAVAVEKIVRRLRNALPNSVLVSTPLGRCIEYIPVVGGTSSIGEIAKPSNSISVADFDLTGSAPFYAAVYPISSNEIYVGTPGAAGILATSTVVAGSGISSIGLSNPGGFTFVRTSPTERVYLTQSTERFCVTATGDLNFYSGYGIPDYSGSGLTDTPTAGVAATASLIARDVEVASSGFSYSPGTLVRNAIADVTLNLLKDDDPVRISHEVQIRNVP